MTLLHAEGTPEVRRAFTVWICGLWLVRLWMDPLIDLTAIPVSEFSPVGPPGWLPRALEIHLLEPGVLQFLWWSSVAALVCILFDRLTSPAWLVAVVGLTTIQSIVRGFGHINHAEVCLLYAVYALALTAGIERMAVRPANAALQALPLVMTASALSFTYSLVAIYRLSHGAPAIFTSGSLVEWMVESSYAPVGWHASLGAMAATTPARWAVAMSFPVVTLFELAAPLCLILPRFRALCVPVLGFFHVATALSMNIVFWESFALLPLLTTFPRRFAPVPVGSAAPPVIFFDGVCGLCNRFVDYVIAHDRLAILRFSALQGDAARRYLGPDAPAEASVVLMDEDGTHRRSDAILRALARLGGVHAAARLISLVPRALRDRIYDEVARRRYRIWGTTATCRLPSPEERVRFLS